MCRLPFSQEYRHRGAIKASPLGRGVGETDGEGGHGQGKTSPRCHTERRERNNALPHGCGRFVNRPYRSGTMACPPHRLSQREGNLVVTSPILGKNTTAPLCAVILSGAVAESNPQGDLARPNRDLAEQVTPPLYSKQYKPTSVPSQIPLTRPPLGRVRLRKHHTVMFSPLRMTARGSFALTASAPLPFPAGRLLNCYLTARGKAIFRPLNPFHKITSVRKPIWSVR